MRSGVGESAVGGSGCGGGAFGFEVTDAFGDDVAGLADDDGVADANVLAGDLVFVVEGGHLDGGAGEDDGLHHGAGGERSGAADGDEDVLDDGRLLLGRELIGDGPAGAAGYLAEVALEGERIDL